MTPSAVTTNNATPSVPVTASTSSRTSSWRRSDRYWLSTGTKACANAPSAKKRLSMFGMRLAIRKASIAGVAPNMRVNTMSRTRPRMRDNTVMKPTTPVERSNEPADGGSAGSAGCFESCEISAAPGSVGARGARRALVYRDTRGLSRTGAGGPGTA